MVVVAVASRRSPAGMAVRLLLLAALLLACTATAGVAAAAAAGKSSTLCDTAKCGKGNCSEVPGLIPLISAGYKCTCDPGWSQPKLFNLTILEWAPCIIPDCLFDAACYNFSFLFTPPDGIPLFNPCVAVKCGWGECKSGDGLSYSCECQPGYTNFLNQPEFPCLKNCSFGADCSELGILPPPPPPPPPSTAPPPGSPSSWRLVQHLLSLAILLLQIL